MARRHIPAPITLEEIFANPFVVAIQTHYQSILVSLRYNDWILAVPHASSFTSMFTDREIAFSEEFVATHVLRSISSDNGYITLDNKKVYVKDHHLVTDKGFSESRKCLVLFDDIIQDDGPNKSGIAVYCIDQPLVRLGGVEDESTRHIAESAVSFRKIIDAMETGKVEISKIEEAVLAFNDRAVEIDSLETLKDEVKLLVEKCFVTLGAIDEKALRGALEKYGIEHEMVFQAAETFIMESAYEILFFKVCSYHREKDTVFSEVLVDLQDLDLRQMGLPEQYGWGLMMAVKEFQTVAALRTPFEKIRCLMRSIELFSSLPSNSSSPDRPPILSGDVIIPLMAMMVIRSNVVNLHSSLYFMNNFTFGHDVLIGEYGYALSSLEAASTYLEEHHSLLSTGARRNRSYWSAVRCGDLTAVKYYFEGKVHREEHEPISAKSATPSLTADASVICDAARSRDVNGDDAVLMAVQSARLEVLKYLLESGMCPATSNYNDTSVLHICAASDAHLPIAHYLLDHHSGAIDIEARDHQGNTPLLVAVQHHNEPLFILLLEKGANAQAQNDAGMSIIHSGNASDIRSLLGAQRRLGFSINLNLWSHDGLTPLLYHCQHGHALEIEELIWQDSVDLMAQDLGQRTPLHLCAFKGLAHAVEMLLQTPAVAVDAESLRGNTALHAAADSGNFAIAHLLLEAGADPAKRNAQGRSPADLSKEEALTDLLDDYGLFASCTHVPKNLGEKVAAIVRAVVESDKVYFVVKSGTFRDVASITTVFRELDDFRFLRSQLLEEYSEVCLPEFEDLFDTRQISAAVLKNNPSSASRTLRKIIKRLTVLFDYLLSHPTLKDHELVWEFLVLSDLELDMIKARSASKIEYLLENIFESYAPIVEDLEKSDAEFHNVAEVFGALVGSSGTGGVRSIANSARRMGKLRRDFANNIRTLRYHMSKPSLDLFPRKDGVATALKCLGDISTRQSAIDTWEIGEVFLESATGIAGALSVLPRHDEVAAVFRTNSKHTATIQSQLTRVEAQAKTNSTDENVKKLSEIYFQYQTSSRETQRNASLLNYTDISLRSELQRFHEYQDNTYDQLLRTYAQKQIQCEKEAVDSILKALDMLECTMEDLP
ncbi:uncharacterized protein BJ171DRAFT_510094 [Polychytrium aggregatum]|uniref:uncharacterized protein n=1 Tax=Polychytrium aggregatum TaxID=110093 RepID=UPI0022FF2149|nr:uncharacterized protein BJ171DRAFT_510094 [Polychytrium aggregatum]KAI9203241.1 hypothetical protein BJ171DRAFT_510094 [Polychytrium aggregatum]